MGKLDAFRKLIREELRQVLKEELKNFLAEAKPAITPRSNFKNTIQESISQRAKPVITKTAPIPVAADPIQQLIQETAFNMEGEEYRTLIGATSDLASGFPHIKQAVMPEEYVSTPPVQVVSSVSEMISSAPPTTDITQVSIDVVPDFTEFMNTLKNKGTL